ncbi:MAG: deoxyribose-phosphate aldolase [Anaerolineales bacterium]|nr:deoxyribose-phosphate aldolase [Anaerolineales bacterium]
MPPPPIGAEIAGWIEHTLLKPEATAAQVKVLCQEALQYHFASVCVNPAYVTLVSALLSGSPVKTCAVVGFPLGATLPTQKVVETLACLENGAVEIDMVINIGAMKGEAYGLVYNEVQTIAQVVHNQRAVVKVILETALLRRKEKIIACLVCKAAGVDFVKTSTGFGPGGATVEDVDLIYRLVGPQVRVKASGGIRSLETALAMIRAGATRLGTSSGVQIVKEAVA